MRTTWRREPLPNWRFQPHEASWYLLKCCGSLQLHSPTTFSYACPLQKTCPRVQEHKALRGTSSDGRFLSQSASGLSSKFWERCFSNLETANSLRDGTSLASAVSSLGLLYNRWKEGKLSTNVLNILRLAKTPNFSSDGFQKVVLQTIMDPTVPWTAGRRYHFLLVTTGMRTSRKRSLRRSTTSRSKRGRTGTANCGRAPGSK